MRHIVSFKFQRRLHTCLDLWGQSEPAHGREAVQEEGSRDIWGRGCGAFNQTGRLDKLLEKEAEEVVQPRRVVLLAERTGTVSNNVSE